jgi:hypothetical protein
MAVDPVTLKLIFELSNVLVGALVRIGRSDEAEVIKNSSAKALANYTDVKDWSKS